MARVVLQVRPRARAGSGSIEGWSRPRRVAPGVARRTARQTPMPTPTASRWHAELAFAEQLAAAARAIARLHFRSPIAVEQKADLTPVTIADRAIEAELRRMIRERHPGHGILGEEYGTEAGDDATWVIDPIDGTKAYVTGMPTWGTLIALLDAGRPVLGVIEAPAMDERWLGAAGIASTLNGAPARTSGCERLAEASLYATSPDMFQGEAALRFERASRRARLCRYGGDCYAYGLLASGHVDLVIEADLKPYDWCALVPVVEGAGGMLRDWQGRPLTLASSGAVIAAASEALLAEAVQALAD